MRLRGARLGSLIGAVGGLAFVEINAGGLTGSLVVRIVGLLVFVGVVVGVVRAPDQPERAHDSSDGGRHGGQDVSMRTYWISVAAMVVAFVVGSVVLRALDRTDLQLAWVVLVVGLHFVPFSRAFHAPVFLALAGGLITVAVVGGGATLAGSTDAAGWTGVAAGFVLLAFSAWGVFSVRDRSATRPA